MKPIAEGAEEQADADDSLQQELFVRQPADHSLPAAQVLSDQIQNREAQDPAPLFVP